MADVEDVAEVIEFPALGADAAPSRDQVSSVRTSSPALRRIRVVATPDEQPGQVQAVVGMQMGEQDLHITRIRVPLQAPNTPPPKSITSGGVSGALRRYPDAGESGPTTLPEQPSTVIRTVTSLPCPISQVPNITAFVH